jgi:catechol 2,3-dioxygenase-like lactoylglutathione lyase family enzyme
MADLSDHEARRERLRQRYLSDAAPAAEPPRTNSVDHLALISSDLDATIQFYTGVLKMRLTKVIANRDAPTSTHIFLDMGGGNLLAFFDFPEHGPAPSVRGVGAMHHIALKADPAQFRAVLGALEDQGIAHSLHGTAEKGSVYMRDPDNIMVEVTTGY